MSDDDASQMQRICEILHALNLPNLTAEERARLDGELDALGLIDPLLAAGKFVVLSELAGLQEYLKNRQGSVVPDFDELHRRKAELDRKLLGGEL